MTTADRDELLPTPISARVRAQPHQRRSRIPEREPSAPFEVGHKSRPKFRVTGKFGIVSGKAHQRDEPESLVIGDVER